MDFISALRVSILCERLFQKFSRVSQIISFQSSPTDPNTDSWNIFHATYSTAPIWTFHMLVKSMAPCFGYLVLESPMCGGTCRARRKIHLLFHVNPMTRHSIPACPSSNVRVVCSFNQPEVRNYVAMYWKCSNFRFNRRNGINKFKH